MQKHSKRFVAKARISEPKEVDYRKYLVIQETKYGLYVFSEVTKSRLKTKVIKEKEITITLKIPGSRDTYLDNGLSKCGDYTVIRSWDLGDVVNIKMDDHNPRKFYFEVDAFGMYNPIQYETLCKSSVECKRLVEAISVIKQKIDDSPNNVTSGSNYYQAIQFVDSSDIDLYFKDPLSLQQKRGQMQESPSMEVEKTVATVDDIFSKEIETPPKIETVFQEPTDVDTINSFDIDVPIIPIVPTSEDLPDINGSDNTLVETDIYDNLIDCYEEASEEPPKVDKFEFLNVTPVTPRPSFSSDYLKLKLSHVQVNLYPTIDSVLYNATQIYAELASDISDSPNYVSPEKGLEETDNFENIDLDFIQQELDNMNAEVKQNRRERLRQNRNRAKPQASSSESTKSLLDTLDCLINETGQLCIQI